MVFAMWIDTETSGSFDFLGSCQGTYTASLLLGCGRVGEMLRCNIYSSFRFTAEVQLGVVTLRESGGSNGRTLLAQARIRDYMLFAVCNTRLPVMREWSDGACVDSKQHLV